MKKSLSALSLRTLMLSLVGLLVVIALLLAGYDLLQSQAAYRNAQWLAESNLVADSCLQAVKSFAFERGRSNVVLHSPNPVDETSRRFIDERRAAADTHIGAMLARLPERSHAKGDAVERAWDRVKSLRPLLEQDFSRRFSERDPAVSRQWTVASNDLVVRLEEALIDVSHVLDSVDARFHHLSNLRVSAVQFRTLVGAESSLLAVALSPGHVNDREMISAANLLRGRSMQAWSQIELDAERTPDPLLPAALGKVQSELFGRLRPLQDEIVRALDRGESPAVNLDHYLEVAVPALDSAIDVVDGIGRIAELHTRNRLDRARWQALVSLASIVAILILGGLAANLLIRRFTWPLNEIMTRINKLLDAFPEASPKVSPLGGGDEFSRVRQALTLLDEVNEARRRSEEALDDSERISASILACVPQSVIATDVNGLITVFSLGAENMLGYSPDEVIGQQTPLQFHDPKEVQRCVDALSRELGSVFEPDFNGLVARATINTKPDEREWTYLRKNGTRITVLLSVTSLRDASGDIHGYLLVATDITERKQIEDVVLRNARERDKQNNLLNTLLKTIPVGVLMVEAPSGKPLVANDAATLLLGREIPSGVNKNNFSRVFSISRLPGRMPYPTEELPFVIGMQGLNSHVEDMMIVRPDGSECILEVTGSPVRDREGIVWASVVSLIDITGRSMATAEMTRLAHYDHLTRLPNRRLFHDRIQMAITQARRDKVRLALMMIDLDRFKPVNDNLGHSVGDLLLKAVAKRMQECLRESDTLARVGGDEFVAILPNIGQEQDALGVGEKIRLVLNEPFELAGGYKVSIACSIGITLYPDHGKDEKRLLKNADDAMYAAKELGRNCVQLFTNGTAGSKTRNGAGLRDLSVVRLVWHRSYRCGEPSIDHEHHELFDRANTLIQAVMVREEMPEKFPQSLDELIDSLVEHFANEEAILARYSYPDLDDHVLKHQRLLGRALELRRVAVAGELVLGDLVTFLAQEVVVKHMLSEDRKFFPMLRRALNHERPDSVLAPNEH